MTTVESGTAVNIEYPEEDTRAVALHESGHAAASHVYMKDAESTRISIRMRGESLGHHQAAEQVERFSQWQSDQMATLIWGLGAMAAERVFYGQTTSGVGGDIQTVTAARRAHGRRRGHGPRAARPRRERCDAKEEDRVLRRFEDIGLKLMNRTGSIQDHDVAASVLSDRDKRKLAAQILGQAYVTAHNLMRQNRTGIEKIADEVVARREIYGDELVELLEKAKLEAREDRPARGGLVADAVEKKRRSPVRQAGCMAREHRHRRRLPGGARALRVPRLHPVGRQQAGRRTSPRAPTSPTRRRTWPTTSRRRTSSTAQPIAVVQAQPLLYQDAAVDGIGFTRQPFRKIGSPIKQFEPADATIAYVFCGTADKCGLSQVGSQETVPLLRREALELALYTFKYSTDVDSVVSLLPPRGTDERRDLPQAREPRRRALEASRRHASEHRALSYGGMSEVERARVMRLTANHLYDSRFVPGPNGRTLLVLQSVG